MSQAELAARLSVNQKTVHATEAAEVDGRIQLSTLARAADALGCDLVYALVPRQSLREIVDARAVVVAAAQVRAVDQSMLLEDQLSTGHEERIRREAARIAERGVGLWHPVRDLPGPDADSCVDAGSSAAPMVDRHG